MQEFYKSLDHTRLAIFSTPKNYTVHNEQSALLPPPLTTTLTITQVDTLAYHCLKNLGIPVDEYDANFVLVRTGTPGNWNDFRYLRDEYGESVCAALAYGNNELGVAVNSRRMGSININQGEELDSSLCINKVIIRYTTISNDDLFSLLWNILNDYNVKEVIYDNSKILKFISNYSSIYSHYHSSNNLVYRENNCILVNKSISMLKQYLRLGCIESELLRTNAVAVHGVEHYNAFTPVTAQGRRLLKGLMQSPLLSVQDIKDRQALSTMINRRTPQLNKFNDLRRTVDMIENGRISLECISRLSQIVYKSQELYRTIAESMDDVKNNTTNDSSDEIDSKSYIGEVIINDESINMYLNTILNPLDQVLINLHPMAVEIDRIITPDCRINYLLDEGLKTLKQEIENINVEIEAEHSRVAGINKKIRLEDDNFKVGRAEFRENEFHRNKFVIVSTLKAGVVFTTLTLSKLVKRKTELLRLVEEGEKLIKKKLIEFVKQFVSLIEVLNYLIAYVDVLNAFGSKIVEGWVYPFFGDSYWVVGMFHPGIINPIRNDLFNSESKNYLGTNVGKTILGGTETDKNISNSSVKLKKYAVITGPNMGGKSTFLKTIATLSIYGQMGAPVPARKCILPLFDSIFMRSGAKDCASRSISTFQSEMNDVSFMCRHATKDSLILIDELGRGTSAIDGLSISIAVKNHFIALNCFCFTATHFTQLCSEEALNFYIEIVDGLISYVVKSGISRGSFGVEVARRAKVDKVVVDLADSYLRE